MMSGKHLPGSAAAIAGALVVLAAAGCEREPSVASKSAAAFREAQKRGQTFGGEGHAHGHGAASEKRAPQPASGASRHEHEHGGHAPMEHGGRAAPRGHAGHGPSGGPTPPTAAAPPARDHAGHAPAPPGAQPAPYVAEATAVAAGHPAATLRPDALDAPSPTALIEARRAEEVAAEMTEDHGAHGAGTYRQVDAGRGPEAYEEPPQPPGKPDPPPEHQHDPPGLGGPGGAPRRPA